jgi:hypothetical protein
MIPLLCLSDRMIRSRVLEILSCLFSWDNDPLLTLNLATEQSNVDQGKQKFNLCQRSNYTKI